MAARALSPDSVPRVRARGQISGIGVQEEDLDRGSAARVGAAEKYPHRATGEVFDRLDELGRHRVLQDVALKPDEIGSARRDEIAFGIGGPILEDADHDVLIDERARPLGAAAGEVGDQPADLVGQGSVQSATGQVFL